MHGNLTDQQPWSILRLIQWTTNYLLGRGFEEARLHTELLLSHVLHCSRIDLYLKFDMILGEDELARFKTLLERRLVHEPLQYILGETEFMGLRLIVNRAVLIPRAETEILVEEMMKQFKGVPSRQIRILDVGTGSGNISIALARLIPNAIIDAIDISREALEVARLNINNHHLGEKISVSEMNILGGMNDRSHIMYDALVSNPPYVSQEEFMTLQPEVKEYEPSIASTDFGDGLTFYRSIAEQGKELLHPGGWVFVEISYNQSEQVVKLFRNAGYSAIEVYRDYSGIKRVVKGQRG